MLKKFKTCARKVKAKITKVLEKLFLIPYPGKKGIKTKALLINTLSPLLAIGTIYSFVTADGDTSRLETGVGVFEDDLSTNGDNSLAYGASPKGLAPPSKNSQKSKKKRREGRAVNRLQAPDPTILKAQQVLKRGGAVSSDFLPVGTGFIGRLVTQVDTRSPGQFARIILPFGGAFRGKRVIPKNSVLFGFPKPSVRQEKIHLEVRSGVTPDGTEFKLSAVVLDPATFAPGLAANHHGTFEYRAGAMALNSLSGFANILQEKESLGNGNTVSKKPTLKNAGLEAASRFSELEAKAQASELQGKRPYLTLSAGTEVIVSLTETYRRKP